MLFFGLILAGIILLVIVDHRDIVSDGFTKTIAGFLGLLAGLAAALTATLIIGVLAPKTAVPTETIQPIYALTDNIVTEGTIRGGIFYTRGYIDGDLQYYYLTDADNRGQKIEHVAASYTYLNEIAEGEQPTIEFHYTKWEFPDWFIWGVCPFLEWDDASLSWVRLNVPETTLPDGFTIDMQ